LAWRLTEKVQQVDQGAAQAIDRRCRDHVNVTPSDGLEQAIEGRPLVAALGAGDTGILEKLETRQSWRSARPCSEDAGHRDDQHPRQMPLILRSRVTSSG